MKTNLKLGLLGASVLAGSIMLAQHSADAGTMTGVCSTCHTMHNSQNGTNMGLITAQDYLLRNNCVGCHSDPAGTDISTNDAPIVWHTTQPTDDPTGLGASNYLAGGSFYYIMDAGGDDAFGHNVADLGLAADGNITGTNPPGNVGGSISTQLTCEGAYGCHSYGAHHNNVGGERSNPALTVWVDGSSAGASYRFLNTNRTPGAFTGVQGGENGDWEYVAGPDDHNVYWAYNDYDTAQIDHLTGFCARCHGNFHGSVGLPYGTQPTGIGVASPASPWIRHPTDFRLSDASTAEYAGYTSYNFIVPVAVDSDTPGATGAGTGPQFDDVTVAGHNNVSCVSCHRAHGSPYADMLRWSYGLMNAGQSPNPEAGNGCFQCHTTK
jgi:hypothetical protein